MTMIHNFEIVMCDQDSSLNLVTRLWHKLTASPILNHKLLEYMKLTKIVIVQVFGSIKNEHTFSMFNFMKINCGIDWMCTWIYAFDFIANVFLHCRIFLRIKPLPNGKAKHIMMSMHRYKQVHGVHGVFEGFSKVKKKSWMLDNDVVEFWHMKYLFWNLCFQVNLWTCIFPLFKFHFGTTLWFWWTHLF